MKLFLFSLFTLVLSCSACYAQRTFTYKINQQVYSIEEQKLNDLFGAAFSKIVAYGATKDKYFDIWTRSYSQWKDFTVDGVWVYQTIGDRVSGLSYEGHIDEMFLGWDVGHKEPKGNPNNQKNWAKRMQILNTYLSREIIYYLTRKEIIN